MGRKPETPDLSADEDQLLDAIWEGIANEKRLSEAEPLDLNCPECGEFVRPVFVEGDAVKTAERKCPECKTRWVVRVVPMGIGEIDGQTERFDSIEWDNLNREEDS